MGYIKIPHLYRPEAQVVLLFKEVYCLEKIDGTSSSIHWKDSKLNYFSGGEKYDNFIKLFDNDHLIQKFTELFGDTPVRIYGETYGNKQQGMRHTYGDYLRFIAFDVRIGHVWLSVPKAEDIVNKFGLEFVDYVKVPTKPLDYINNERDKPSVQAKRNGIQEDKMREGIVIRPLEEMRQNNGARVIAKYKNQAFEERKNTPKVKPRQNLEVLKEAQAIAEEWVTPMRLEHVLQKLPEATGLEHTKLVINAMVDDVYTEGKGEIVESRAASYVIGKQTVKLWKKRLQKQLEDKE